MKKPAKKPIAPPAKKKPPCGPAELEERVIRARDMLAAGKYKHQVKRMLKDEYHIGTQQCEEMVARARKRLAEETCRSPAEQADNCANVLEHVIATTVDEAIKINAVRTLAKLRGLNKPEKHAFTDPTGLKDAGFPVDNLPLHLRKEILAALRGPDKTDKAAPAKGVETTNGHV